MNAIAKYIREELGAAYTAAEAAWLSRIICCEMLGQTTADYYMGKDITLSDKQKAVMQATLHRLLCHEPIQYIQGYTAFCGHRFEVTPDVLIPRPETEELVGLIVSENTSSTPCILDACTGSGCIAVSLKLAVRGASVTGLDISPEAVGVARRNAGALHADCTWLADDIFGMDADRYVGSFDIIVSNPPYVTDSERAGMERNVLDWEPAIALFVPDADPLRFYRRIAQMGRTMLKTGGRLYFEINRAYGSDMKVMLADMGYSDIQIRKDMSGNDRFALATL